MEIAVYSVSIKISSRFTNLFVRKIDVGATWKNSSDHKTHENLLCKVKSNIYSVSEIPGCIVPYFELWCDKISVYYENQNLRGLYRRLDNAVQSTGTLRNTNLLAGISQLFACREETALSGRRLEVCTSDREIEQKTRADTFPTHFRVVKWWFAGSIYKVGKEDGGISTV